MPKRPLLLAVVAASGAAALQLTIYALITQNEEHLKVLSELALYGAVAFTLTFLYAAAVATIVGIPMFLLFRKLGMVGWWYAYVVGPMIGIGVAFALRART